MEIRLIVLGKPQPAGSKTAYVKAGRAVVTDANKKSKPWKKLVIEQAQARYGGVPLRGPIEVEMTFYRARPKHHFGTGRNAEVLKASAPAHPTSKPDALKLARGVEDALTKLIYEDDAQIVREHLTKAYGLPERCEVVIRPL